MLRMRSGVGRSPWSHQAGALASLTGHFQPAADRGGEPAPHATLAVPKRGEGEGGDGNGGAGDGGLEAILVEEEELVAAAVPVGGGAGGGGKQRTRACGWA